jgi:hypothetical protein
MTRTYTRGAPNVRPGMTFDAFIKASSMQFGGCSDCVDIARAIRRRTPGNVQGDGEDGRSFVTETCFDITGNEEHRKGDLPGTVDRRLGSRHRRGYPCGSAPQLAVDQAEPCRSWRVDSNTKAIKACLNFLCAAFHWCSPGRVEHLIRGQAMTRLVVHTQAHK